MPARVLQWLLRCPCVLPGGHTTWVSPFWCGSSGLTRRQGTRDLGLLWPEAGAPVCSPIVLDVSEMLCLGSHFVSEKRTHSLGGDPTKQDESPKSPAGSPMWRPDTRGTGAPAALQGPRPCGELPRSKEPFFPGPGRPGGDRQRTENGRGTAACPRAPGTRGPPLPEATEGLPCGHRPESPSFLQVPF